MIFNLMKPVPVQTETWETLFEGEVTTVEEQILASVATNSNGFYSSDFTYGYDHVVSTRDDYEGYQPKTGDKIRITLNGVVSKVLSVTDLAPSGSNYWIGYVGNLYLSPTHNYISDFRLHDDGGECCVIMGDTIVHEYAFWLYTRTAGIYNLKIERMVN